MGAAASKTAAASARAGAPHVIRTQLTREDLTAMALRPARMAAERGPTGVELPGAPTATAEMREELLHRAERFEELSRVEYLSEMTEEFERTASGHRPRSATPVAMPKNRTAAVSTGGAVVEEAAPGRLSATQLRALLRLHYEEPNEWTPEVLARKYQLDERTVRNVLRAVGPPNVLSPVGPSEHPMGVWYAPTPAQIAE